MKIKKVASLIVASLPLILVLAMTLALALALAPSAQAFPDESLSGAAKAWLAEHQEIVFAGQAAYPPFEFVDERSGEYTGMAVELIRWIAAEYGFTATFRPMPFEDAQKALLRGSVDALTGIFESPERSLRYDLSQAVFSVPASIYARSDRTDIRSIADLNGKRVAVQRGDYAIEFLAADHLLIEFVYADDFRSALQLVASGKADALIGDEYPVRYFIRMERLDDTLRKVSGTLYLGKDCMAVAKGDAMLHTVLNAGIARARSSGTLDTIFRKWTGLPYGESDERSPRLAIIILSAVVTALIIIGTLIIWRLARRATKKSLAAAATELESLRKDNTRLSAENAGLRRDLEERSRLEAAKRRIDAEASARRVEELTRLAITKALDPDSDSGTEV